MQPIQFFAARAEDGALLPGATVDVFVQGTQGRAPLFADSPCTVPLGNPVSADANARVFFYTTTPRIDMRISRYGYVAPLIVDISTWDAATAVEWVQSEIDAALGEIGDSLAEMEDEFVASQIDKEQRFRQFLLSSGYQLIGDYGPGLLITELNQIFAKDGELYRAGAALVLPYLTTGVWANESAKFVSVGDAALRQELARADGSAKVTFTQQGAGAASRNLQDRMRDTVSVKDFGALGILGADNTAAFLAADRGAYVPAGKYKVDTLVVDLYNYHGPGEIYALNGQVIRLDNEPGVCPYNQRRVMAPVFGGAAGVPGIYPGSTNAPQGLARFRHPVTGEESFFINQLVSGTSWSATERSCTSRWLVREDGQPQTVAEFTPPMKQSHAHLSCLYENNQLWMYQSFVAPDDAIDNTKETGCGWSKFPWKGAANVSADIINYRVWGRPGSGHRYEHYGKACVQVSQDGRYMIMVGINYSGTAGGRTVFVYDRLQVESAANPLDCEPIYISTPLRGLDNDADTAYQGEASDGRYIYICWGSGAVFGRRGVTVYTLTGEKLRDIVFDGPAAEYTNDQLRNGHPTLGICVAHEPEGLALWGDRLFVSFTDNWVAYSTVVSFYGKNYINLVAGNQGTPPDESSTKWRITDLPASEEYNPATPYGVGPVTLRDKTIYELTPPKGDVRERPLISRYRLPASVAQYPGNTSELINVSFDHGGNWRGSSHVPSTDSYRIAFEFFQNAWRVRDARTGSDNSKWAGLRLDASPAGQVASLRSAQGIAADGAWLDLYTNESPSLPGEVRLSSSGAGIMRLMQNGTTKLQISATENVLYQTTRFVETNTYSWGTASRVGTTIYLQTAPVVSSDARLKTPVRSMAESELIVGRRLARELGFYKWLCSIDEKGDVDARWHAGMTVQRAIEIFQEEGLDPFEYGAVCRDEWGDEFETVDAVWIGTGRFKIYVDKEGNEVDREEIKEKWADAAERQTLWAGDKFSFREGELHNLMIRALAHDQDQINERLLALENR